ncbi:MAG: type II toxin-antitoxin system VapC family toxin [Candidatus Paceibacterota bacterium]
MRLLLDTHTLLWFVLGDGRCSEVARELIEDDAHEKWISPASHWELAIKISLGKYSAPIPFVDFFERAVTSNGFLFLPIEPRHTALLTTMPFHHRDPFDRLMIAQATAEGMHIVSADKVLDNYSITRLW